MSPSEPKPPLSVLRLALREAASDEAIEAFAASLEGDERAGARALRAQAERKVAAARAERQRLAGLLALRDRLRGQGLTGIAGVDEVGVGPLAGPVVAAAVVLPEIVSLPGLDDSKRVRPAARARLAADIEAQALGFGVGEVSVEEIDQMGIFQAALEAMRRAVKSVDRVVPVEHLLVDARTVPGIEVPQTSIIKGDQKDASIAAASIVAKESRDRTMRRMGERYPGYGFEQHMGYGTAAHLEALERLGPCPIHRHSFAPVERAARRVAARPGPAATS